jgi:hypothetical protein
MNQRQYIKLDQMDKRLKLKIEEFNKIKYNKNNSKRIIIGTLKPNCDKSLKRSNQ